MNLVYRIRYNAMDYLHELAAHTTEKLKDGSRKELYRRFLELNLRMEIIALRDPDFAVTKYTAVFYNETDRPVRLYQLDTGVSIASDSMSLRYFTSDWGSEFYPHEQEISGEFSFGSVSGRSSKGFSPWAGLVTSGRCYSAALAWSGSWNCTVTPEEGRFHFTMGHSYDGFFTDVPPGGRFESASVYLAEGKTLEDASLEMRRFFRRRLSLLNDGGIADVPLEYNEWWPYEDKYINENIYLENAKIAKELGCRYAMMDAGWFGGNEDGQSWYEKRGDWSIVNKKDFPSGMKSLCDNAKKIGILPGIWCEIEAVGKDAKLNDTHGHIIAKRDGKSLGYVCFGSEEGRAWAMSVVDQILGEYGAKWIKFDFNLDPAPGCNAQGHGHGPGDGLYAHYVGYYRLLEEIHKKYPDVVIENCASGGLRDDIKIASLTHWSHLSDPDYTEFHLQVYWGALSYLHQSALLHFSWSQVLQTHNLGILNPISEDMERYKFDYMIRAVLMGVPGFSYRLPEMPDWCKERLKELGQFYEEIYKDYILNGDAHRLTPQPVVGGMGERFPVFQFNNARGEAIVFAFRLQKARAEQTVYPRGLVEDALYEVVYTDAEKSMTASGRDLESKGLVFSNMPEESSEVVRIRLKMDGEE
jgi:alpha-galactosidase